MKSNKDIQFFMWNAFNNLHARKKCELTNQFITALDKGKQKNMGDINRFRDEIPCDLLRQYLGIICRNITGSVNCTVTTEETPIDHTESNDATDTSSGFDAFVFICVVLSMYSVGIVVMLVTYVREEERDYEEEKIVREYFKMIVQDENGKNERRLRSYQEYHEFSAANIIHNQSKRFNPSSASHVWR